MVDVGARRVFRVESLDAKDEAIHTSKLFV